MLKASTGATSAYIGVKSIRAPEKEEEVELPVITFIAGTEGSKIEGATLVRGKKKIIHPHLHV